MEEQKSNVIAIAQKAQEQEPKGPNRAQRRAVGQGVLRLTKVLKAIPHKEFEPMDISGLEYKEGVTAPKLDPTWPWVLEEIVQAKEDDKILKHTFTGMSTNQVSAIRIQYAKPEDHVTFRRGKPLALEFNDATTTFKLTRQKPKKEGET